MLCKVITVKEMDNVIEWVIYGQKLSVMGGI